MNTSDFFRNTLFGPVEERMRAPQPPPSEGANTLGEVPNSGRLDANNVAPHESRRDLCGKGALRGSLLTIAILLLLPFGLAGQQVYTYIGRITPTSVLIAWGTATGRSGENTIGRDAASKGSARVRVGTRVLETDKSWAEVDALQPDTTYNYDVSINGAPVGSGTVRTYPARAQRMAFFVIGDFGNGSSGQRAIAEAMWREFQRRAGTDNPVRFVLTVGDNVYGNLNLGYISLNSGDQDRHWESKYFAPYKNLIAHVPFYPTLGNHDGNASESRGDLAVYLDNFFFPGNRPARWYGFSYGGMADFFALDSTENTTGGRPAPAFAPDGDQFKWLEEALRASQAAWKIPYFHHPPFNAGPGHGASYSVLRHWVELFQRSGVRVVFTGHEHNFQVSESNEQTGNIRYFVTGAGGELRGGDVTARMAAAHIEGFAAQRHFLAVEIDGRAMRVTPVSNERMVIRDRAGKEIGLPITIELR